MTTEEKAKAYAEKAYYPAPEYGWYESDHEAMTESLPHRSHRSPHLAVERPGGGASGG